MRWLRFAIFPLLLACGTTGPVAPLVTVAAAVAEVAIERAAAHDCLGQCGVGSECDHSSGMCRHIPCGGRCRSDWICQVTNQGEECVPVSLALPAASACTPLPDAGSLLIVRCDEPAR